MTIYSTALIRAQYAPMEGLAWGDFVWWMIPMMVGMILFWGLVILGIVWLVRGGLGPREGQTMSAMELLERRLAEGDLTVEEYRERRDVLTS